MRRLFAPLLAAIALPAGAAPTTTDIQALEALEARLVRDWEAGRGSAFWSLRAVLGPHSGLVYVDPRGEPVFYAADNLAAADTTNTDELWPGGASGLSLDGDRPGHAYLGVWDGGSVRDTHDEFGGRRLQLRRRR